MKATPARQLRTRRAELIRRINRDRPDVAFAVRFLPAFSRQGVMVVTGLALLLSEILDPNADANAESRPSTGTEGSTNSESPASRHRHPKETPADLAMNRTVAHNVIRFLYEEAEPGAVGRAEIEMFLDLREREEVEVPDHAWTRFVDALTDWRSRARFATLDDLLTHVDRVFDPIRYLLVPIVGLPVETSEDAESTEELGHSLSRAIMMTSVLSTIRKTWIDGRLVIPLDLLSEFGLRDRDVKSILEVNTPERECAATTIIALRKALTVMAERTHAEFHRFGLRVETLLPAREGRALLLLALQWRLIFEHLDQIIRHAPNPVPAIHREGTVDAARWSFPEKMRAFRDALSGRVDRLTRPFESG